MPPQDLAALSFAVFWLCFSLTICIACRGISGKRAFVYLPISGVLSLLIAAILYWTFVHYKKPNLSIAAELTKSSASAGSAPAAPGPSLPSVSGALKHRPTSTGRQTSRPLAPITPAGVTTKEIVDYASGIVLAVKHDERTYSGTAFWVHTRGYAATCADAVYPGLESVSVAYSAPIYESDSMQVGGNAVIVPALRQAQDGTGTILLGVVLDVAGMNFAGPSQRPTERVHVEKRENAKTEAVIARTWIAELSKELPQVGSKVFLYGLEGGTEFPSYTIHEGQVVRIAGEDHIRAYTNLPFKATYCGAPVFDETRSVVGVISGKMHEGQTEIIPAADVRLLMRSIGLR